MSNRQKSKYFGFQPFSDQFPINTKLSLKSMSTLSKLTYSRGYGTSNSAQLGVYIICDY